MDSISPLTLVKNFVFYVGLLLACYYAILKLSVPFQSYAPGNYYIVYYNEPVKTMHYFTDRNKAFEFCQQVNGLLIIQEK